MRRSVESTEYLKSTVTSTDYDVTDDVVEWAILGVHEKPTGTTTWVAGDWAPGTTTARLLIGPDGHELAVGEYSVWLRINDSPEIPVDKAGYLTIF